MKRGNNLQLPADVSWMLRKVVEQNAVVQQWGVWNSVVREGKFSIKAAYKKVAGSFPKVPWKGIICRNKATPESKFIVWLLVLQKLHTVDRHMNCVKCVMKCQKIMSMCS